MQKKKNSNKKDILTSLKNFWFSFRETFKNSPIIQRVQISCIYFFATVTFIYNLHSIFGMLPDELAWMIPFSDFILGNNYFKMFGRFEITFLFSYLTFHLMILRPIIKVSTLVKFNILLVSSLEMIFNLILGWWDLLYIRERPDGQPASIPRRALYIFATFEGILFYGLYVYSYICAMQGKFPTYPGVLQVIPDSAACWLKLRKKDKKTEKEK